MRGKFICIEGLDGSGKSTQVRLLANWLRNLGYKVVVTEEPTGGPIGKIIKLALAGKLRIPVAAEALLFAADRLQHVEQVVAPSLNSGKFVISDRYTASSLAYQSARGLPLKWVMKVNEMAPEPDLMILIDVPAEVSAQRINRSRKLDEFEKSLELQRKVRQVYLSIAKLCKMKVVDGNRSIDEVQAEIQQLVKKQL
ncbi:MAG: dTMP kinase [Candidatus Hadarchaeum sp.]|uniref:dTMP kinase n=1 Tax=Candidatus Hadarchaeum sp. TaxID=2883567 RepID=UPI0031824654